MKIHEFGTENEKLLILIHPSLVMWDYFENVIPLLEREYHLVVPALPGYDPDDYCDYTSVEQIAKELGDWLLAHGHRQVYGIYGCSMGGSVVIRMLTLRFIITLYNTKLFDIIVQDQWLVMTSGFFQHIFPETKDCAGWHDRGFNNQNQLIRIVTYPFLCMLTAALFLWIGG